MMECACKFYEPDLKAQAEGEKLAADYEASLSPEQREAEAAWLALQEPEPDPFADCGPYCRHLESGKGMLGEYMYYCGAPGNEHVLDYEFRESEII
jgi:hypothetical protein